MPWESKTVEKIREEFVAKAQAEGCNFSQLCREYHISRVTGYEWVKRYEDGYDLSDRSHAPVNRPHKTAPEMEELVLELRDKQPTWGPRKLHRNLVNRGIQGVPAPSTIAAILKRNDKITPEESVKHMPWRRFEREFSNDLWQMDYKGHFALTNTQRCHPLTMLDDHARYLLCLDAKDNERYEPTKASIERIMREFGMPNTILCDNGPPWGDAHGGYTMFEIWMMQLNILPIHGRIMHPQTQGKDERFHRTLKEDLLMRKPMHSIEHAQNEFDDFRHCYNHERPHEALNLEVPAKIYRKSNRQYKEELQEPEYESGRNLRKVNAKGYISIERKQYYIGESFIGRYLEIQPEAADEIALCYGQFSVARLDLNEHCFVSKRILRRAKV